MKKISKEYSITKEKFYLEYSNGKYSVTEYGNNCKPAKITVTYEKPERKIELTESKFDEVISSWTEFLRYNETHKVMVEQIKQKLFGKT